MLLHGHSRLIKFLSPSGTAGLTSEATVGIVVAVLVLFFGTIATIVILFFYVRRKPKPGPSKLMLSSYCNILKTDPWSTCTCVCFLGNYEPAQRIYSIESFFLGVLVLLSL